MTTAVENADTGRTTESSHEATQLGTQPESMRLPVGPGPSVEYSVDDILSTAEYDALPVTGYVHVVAVEGRLQKYDDETIGFIQSAIKVTKNYTGPKLEYLIGAGLMKVNSGETPLEIIDFTVFGAELSAFAGPVCAGYGAKLMLAGGRLSAFDLSLGVGVSSAIGIVDDSLTLKLLGAGFQVGRKISVSFFDTSFGVDFGRLMKL